MTAMDIMQMNNNSIYDEERLTPIQKFYSNGRVFMTGGTGFLGKMLIYKLLTACPNIESIYLLIRNKKGQDINTRIDTIFDDSMFDTERHLISKLRHKVQGITGDCMQPGLGLTPADKQTLIKNVNIVFHMAATVRFDEKLKVAMQINVQACKDVMQLCGEMVHLKSVVHVSTAYTQCPQEKIEEKFYPPPMDSGKMLLLTECVNDKMLETITPILLDKWPNTYTFTKAIAEDVVHQHGRGLPLGMFRPGIVISSFREPVNGWVDNYYGPTGMLAGVGSGLIRTAHCDPKCTTSMVPVDLCVNGLMACAWDVAERYDKCNSILEAPVYNYCTSKDNELTWEDFTGKTIRYGQMYPTMKAIWYLCYRNNSTRFMHMFCVVLLHYLPALIIDTLAILTGRKPQLLHTYKKIHKFLDVVQYFATRQWNFEIKNVTNLWDQMTPKDREIFFFSMKDLDWNLFLQHYYRGVRQFLLKDPLESVPQALIRWNRLYWLHQFVKACVCMGGVRIMWPWLSTLYTTVSNYFYEV